MSAEAWAMMASGIVMLIAGLVLLRSRLAAASGLDRLLLLGPPLEATALTVFAAEHFLAARDLASIVPPWLPAHLFWTYLVGVALLAAALSFIAFRCVRWSASLLALLFLIIVATIHLPNLLHHPQQRLFWTLTLRELAFAGGALVLAGSQFPQKRSPGPALRLSGRLLVASAFLVYAFEQFRFPRFTPGVPLQKITPGWVPAPSLLAFLVAAALLAAGLGLLLAPTRRLAAALAGIVLLLLTVFLYVPILATEIHSPLVVEGINYVADTLLFAATALLAGFAVDAPTHPNRLRPLSTLP